MEIQQRNWHGTDDKLGLRHRTCIGSPGDGFERIAGREQAGSDRQRGDGKDPTCDREGHEGPRRSVGWSRTVGRALSVLS